MNGKPERWCGRCLATGIVPAPSGRGGEAECPCVRRATPIQKPVRCKACGGRYSPNADGALPRHGSIGWSCDGKIKQETT